MTYSIDQLLQKFHTYLEENRFEQAPKALYDPVNYIMNLGGKRLRPLLVLMAHQLYDEDVDQSLPLALAVETFHNFSLVHDDIMDAALIRRGKPSVHTRYGLNAGILSGDVMLIWVYQYLLRVQAPHLIPQVVRIFNQVAIEVCEGQQYDINFEQRNDVTIPEYLKMIELKTAALMAGSLQLGALVGGAEQEAIQHLDQFGRLIGIAFQLQDDWLDTFGELEKVGKKIGGDIVQNKKTYLILKALETAQGPTKVALVEMMNTPTTNEEEKINWVKNVLSELKIAQLTTDLRDEYREKAFHHLHLLQADNEVKKVIGNLADKLVYREV